MLILLMVYTILLILADKNMFLPKILTHRNNVVVGKMSKLENKTPEQFLKKALFLIGRSSELMSFKQELDSVMKTNSNELFVVRGVFGSGKSHFIRRSLFDYFENNNGLNPESKNRHYILISFQTPITYTVPLNGFSEIFKEIYALISTNYKERKKRTLQFGDTNEEFQCDLIGEALLDSFCYSYMLYIEEILEVSFYLYSLD